MKSFLLAIFATLSLVCFSQNNLIQDGDFENGIGAWSSYEFSDAQWGYGFNGNSGLRISRQDGDAYGVNAYPIALIPNTAYIMRAQVRAENVQHGTACMAIEFHDAKGNWLPQSIYRPGPQGTQDWATMEHKFFAPDIPGATASLLVYLSKGGTGNVYFDNVTLTPLDLPPEIQMVFPTQGQFDVQGALIRFAIAKLGNSQGDKAFEGMTARISFSHQGRQFFQGTVPVVGHLAEVHLEHPPVGEISIRGELLDASGEFLSHSETTLNAVENAMACAPRGGCSIDEYGRALVDGKPFLPIGLFLDTTNKDDDLELIYDSDFNCIMAYGSPRMQLPGSKTTGIPGIVETLDALDAHGLKAIFCLKDLFDLPRYKGMMDWIAKNIGPGNGDEQVTKLVTALRKHPALLAWYDNDEVPLAERPLVAARRQLINRLDPYHPTWGVQDNAMEASFHGSTCDVMGIDPYPVRTKEISDQERTMELVEAARASGQSCWAVPQAFNWGVYPYQGRIPENFDAWKKPTLEQMRGIILMEMIYGIRGFVFYSFFDLKVYSIKRDGFNGADYATREEFLKDWKEVKTLATMLKELSPWILSKTGPQRTELQVQAGKACAAFFRNDKEDTPIVVVANVGPDDLNATLSLPKDFPPMKAQYGHATEIEPGLWQFHGNDCWGEVLLPR